MNSPENLFSPPVVADSDVPALVLSPAVLVAEFHRTFGIPARTTPTMPIPSDEHDLRLLLLREEHDEVQDAGGRTDLAHFAHEVADLVLVAYGTALAYGFDLDAVLAEVHQANMSKLDAQGQVVSRADGKVMKSALFRPADVGSVLRPPA